MYNQINKKFSDGSAIRKNQILLIYLPLLFIVAVVLIIYFCKIDFLASYFKIILAEIIYMSVIGIIYYLYMLYNVKGTDGFSIKNIYKIDEIKNLFMDTLHKKDIELLIGILKEKGINTRSKVQEVLHHYQCLLPRKNIGGGQIIAILALTVSMLALFMQNEILLYEEKIIIIVSVIVLVFLIYLLWKFIYKVIIRAFGQDALNERIECALSEIWVKQLIK